MAIDHETRVITLRWPWGPCVASRRKPCENRPVNVAKFAERSLLDKQLVIHAGLRRDKVPALAPDGRMWPMAFVSGAIVAVVTVDRVEAPGEPQRWDSTGRKLGPPPWRDYAQAGIYFRDVVRLATPVPFTGGEGWRRLFKADPVAYAAVQEQLCG